MRFNINDFRANGLPQGGARPNQFEINFYNMPFTSENQKRLKYVCFAASLPPMDVGEIPVMYFGQAVKYPGDRVFQDWQVMMYNDEDFAARAIFERWNNACKALVSNRVDPAVWPTGMKGIAEVTQLGKSGKILRTYKFDGIWPAQVGAINLDFREQNQVEAFGVNFAYDWYEPVNQDSAIDQYSGVLADDGTA